MAQINKEVVITKVQIYVKNPSSTGTGDTRKNRPLRCKLKETEMDEIWV